MLIFFKKIMIVFFALIVIVVIAIALFMQQQKFGNLPSGNRLERIKKSPNYRDGSFQNLSNTPALTEGVSYTKVMTEFFFSDKKKLRPLSNIPSVKTNLLTLDPSQDILIWFGHSSYFMQLDGKKILVDPVFSGHASPLSTSIKAFNGTDRYTSEDIPEIDYLFISHDHWDHTDYETLLELKPKIKKIITGLGTGEHFEKWGFDTLLIHEKDWDEELILDSGFVAHTVPARHFSGRGLSRNKALWTSFALLTPNHKIFIGGDSGYDSHFEKAGEKFGYFDVAILENGQYDKSWKYIHMMPDQVLKASKDLKAKRLFPVHSSKFALGNHSWDEPLTKISELNKEQKLKLMTPIIGEIVNLNDTNQVFAEWWKGID